MSDYIKLDIKIQPFSSDAADLLAAFLADIGFESFEEYSSGILAYIPEPDFNPAAISNILSDFPFPVNFSFEKSLIPQTDWNEEWEKKYFKPLLIGNGRCVVHSSFHQEFPHAQLEIVIDPKMAFGTGHHATTSMMATFLLEEDLTGKKVIDMGTGTGILAILAKKLGAGETIGIEIDKTAYENALENIELNGVDVLLLNGDASLLLNSSETDIFLANINRNIILADLDRYINTLKEHGMLFLSGFYLEDLHLLRPALEGKNMKIIEIKSDPDGNWAAIKACRI